MDPDRKSFIALLAILLWCQSSTAQSPFYQGKTVNIIVGYPGEPPTTSGHK
jgi:hypothetical protein